AGPTKIPIRMKPMIGVMRKRAKAGMTTPAAPRIPSAPEKPEVANSPSMHCFCPFQRNGGRGGVMTSQLDLVIVGGGPAGMMAGLLFARAGCHVQVLEKHADFFRDFRGDTVHPSTMEILDQLGMLQRFLKRPHNRVTTAQLRMAGRDWTIGDLTRLDTPAPFIAMMPQWDFLDFLRNEARAFPGFHLPTDAPVTCFHQEQGRVAGDRLADGSELRAKLTIAADGRSSIVRAILPLKAPAAPVGAFWVAA